MNQHSLPVRLNQDLAIQQVADDTLVYDERRHLAFCLNRIAAAVWNECDGSQTTAQIAEKLSLLLAHPVSAETVDLAIAQLAHDGLFEASSLPVVPQVDLASISRRSLMARAGAGAVLLLPVVAAIAAPQAAQAYSGGVDGPTVVPSRDSIPADPGESSSERSPLAPEDPK